MHIDDFKIKIKIGLKTLSGRTAQPSDHVFFSNSNLELVATQLSLV